MADTYSTIARIAATARFAERLAACAAQQGADDPTGWVWANRYRLASSPGWAEKVAYWQAANPDADPDGWATDEAVLSDADVLATVQPLLNPPPPEDPELLPAEAT
jgi:hypothetical protein